MIHRAFVLLRGPVLAVLTILGLLLQTGCVNRWLGLGGAPKVEGAKGTIAVAEVERLVDSFADRQVTLIADACEAIKRGSTDPDVQRRAQHVKLANGTAVYDIVTGPHTLARLADLYVLVELQHLVWVDEGGAARRFGDRGKDHLIPAVVEARHEVGVLADLAMKRDRRRKLDTLIRQWRDRNPNVEFISGIRFGSLPEVAGKNIFQSASSFFDLINPVEDASESVEQARLLAARAFYFSKRFPRLLNWQAEAAFDDTMAKSQTRKILENADRVSNSVDRVSRTIERLPDLVAAERAEFLAAWDARQEEVASSAKEIHATVVDAKDLALRATEAAKAFELTFRELHQTFGKELGAPPSKPFDIEEYTAAAAEFSRTAREATVLVERTQTLLESPSLDRLSTGLVDRLAWRLVQIILLGFVLLLLYRLALRFLKPKPVSSPATETHRPPSRFYGSPT